MTTVNSWARPGEVEGCCPPASPQGLYVEPGASSEWLACMAGQGSRLPGVSLACMWNFHSETELCVCLDFRPVALDMSCVCTVVAVYEEASIHLFMLQVPPPWWPAKIAVQWSIHICGSTFCTISHKQSAGFCASSESVIAQCYVTASRHWPHFFSSRWHSIPHCSVHGVIWGSETPCLLVFCRGSSLLPAPFCAYLMDVFVVNTWSICAVGLCLCFQACAGVLRMHPPGLRGWL